MEVVKCDLCGADDYVVINDKSAKQKVGDLAGAVIVNHLNGEIQNGRNVICRRCGLVYVTPRMTEEELRRFYADDYRTFYPHASKSMPHLVNAREALRRHGLLENRIFDVGCDAGDFISSLTNAHGIEPNKERYQEALKRGLAVENSFVENYVPPIKPQVVTMFNALEHVAHPGQVIDRLVSFLEDEGHLLVSVPNLYNKIIRVPVDVFLSCAHLYTFSVDTISAYFKRSGLEVVAIYGCDESMGEKIYIIGRKTGQKSNELPVFDSVLLEGVLHFLQKIDAVYSMKMAIKQLGFL